MGPREAVVPLRRGSTAAAIVVLWALATGAGAQPTELAQCLCCGGWPTCMQVGDGTVITTCSEDPPLSAIFRWFYGRIAWYPLRCVGPITVELVTISPPNTRFPLYVEVVPLRGSADYPYVCENLPGNLVNIVYGHFVGDPCGTWDVLGPIDITRVVPVGSLYALRLYFLGSPTGHSPALDCVRVRAHPAGTPVAPTTWGQVKALFQ